MPNSTFYDRLSAATVKQIYHERGLRGRATNKAAMVTELAVLDTTHFPTLVVSKYEAGGHLRITDIR